MAFISIIYNEGGNPLNYESVEISSSFSNEVKIFDTGNFINDWFNTIKYFIFELENEPFLTSSSVDHFFMDGADFDAAYLHVENNVAILKYIDRNDEMWYVDPITEGIELYVEPGTQPTWEELKEYCK
jgi:hypothetical protein